MAEVTFEQQVAKLWGYIKGFHAVYVVDTGAKLGLFAALKEAGEAGLTPAELAARLELHTPYVETWCKTACALEFLDLDGDGRCRFAPHFDAMLAADGDPRHLAPYCKVLVDHAHGDLSRYPDYFRSGGTYSFQDHGPAFSADIAGTTAGLQVVVARGILPKLPGIGPRLADGLDVLDMGCGGGGLMVQVAKAHPACRVTGVDVDAHGIELAARAIAAAGVGDRVRAELMDGGEIAHADEFDLVTMFEVLHELPVAVRPRVVANCFKALRPGGRLFIVDETYPSTAEELRRPEFFFSVQTGYNELIWGNVVPTRAEQERLLGEAGFAIERRGDIGGIFTTILAAKPG